MRRFAIFFLILVPMLGQPVSAQSLPQDDKALLKAVADKSASIKSLSCNFIQVQKVALLDAPSVSKGEMQYRSDGRIMWRYTSPKFSQMAIAGDKVTVTADGTTRTLSLSGNPMAARLKNLMSGVIGGSSLVSPEGFDVSVSRKPDLITVRMVPSARQLKRLFSEVNVCFSPVTLLAVRFIILDSDGSTTTIDFSDLKTE